jgi:hypothetical protein
MICLHQVLPQCGKKAVFFARFDDKIKEIADIIATDKMQDTVFQPQGCDADNMFLFGYRAQV